MSSSVLIDYTAVMGIQRQYVAYHSAHNSTPGLAALIWVGRLLFLEYAPPVYIYGTLAYRWPSRDQYPSQPDRLDAIRKRYLIRGCYTPFGEIIELKAFAKSIIRQEGIPGNLSWAPGGRSFVIGHDREVKLSDFCGTYHKAIKLVHEQTLADKLRTSCFRGKPFTNASGWQLETCVAYLNAGIELNKSAFPALQLAGGLPGRGTEVTSIRYLNTELALRNVFFYGGRMIIVISYNKARASNNYAFYIVRYLPPDLSLSLLKYLAIIRPALGFLAKQLKLSHYTSNEFFFQDPCGAGHHPRMLLTAYAIDKALPARLQPELLEMYYQLSTTWQEWNQQYYHEICRASKPRPHIPMTTGYEGRKRAASPDNLGRGSKKVMASFDNDKSKSLSDGFIYNAQYQILICTGCESMVQPGTKSFYRHLNSIHRITGTACKTLMDRFNSYTLCPSSELAVPTKRVPRIAGLPIHKGFRCNICPQTPGSSYFTVSSDKIRDHMPMHKLGMVPMIAEQQAKFQRCHVQTFSSAKGRIQYFEVELI
ncbi:hypothetical protein EDB80DRAFT_831381 [Ilyonectria destructans]|nr:hypothetical protein EDB80DRAFT_831381 [Ilyonectria destructans]